MIGYIIAGSVLLLIAIGLYWGARHNAERAFQMRRAETATVKGLKELAEAVGSDPAVGKGNFRQLAEIKGTAVCDRPLTSELAQAACVHYTFTVTREYEEKYWETDSKGNQVQRTRRGSEQVAHNTRTVPFQLDDGTGTIGLSSLEGASLDLVKSHSSFQPASGGMQIGSFLLNLAGLGSNTLGFRYEEKILPVGQRLYALGEASDASGSLELVRPSQKNDLFIVSVKSEEELVKNAKTASTGLTIGAVVALLAGLAVVVIGVLR